MSGLRKKASEMRENSGRHIFVLDPMKLQIWFARIASVFLALSFYSFYQSTVNQTKSFVLPLELRLGRDTSVLQTDATSVTIYAKGPEKEVRKLKISDLNVYAGNTTVSGDGQGSFPIFLERKGDAASQMEVSFSVYPEKAYVIYERSMTKRVPINVLLGGTPAKGYIPIATASPNSVVISGPKSVIENMKEINTMPIDITKRRQPFTMTGSLEYPQNTSLVYDEKVEVVVNFIRPGKTVTFEGLIPEIFNLKDGLRIVSEMPLISVKLTSKEVNLDELDLKDLRLILDCAEIGNAGIFEIPLQIIVSRRGLGVEIDPARVAVEVIQEEAPVEVNNNEPDAAGPVSNTPAVAPEAAEKEIPAEPTAPASPPAGPSTEITSPSAGSSAPAAVAEPENDNPPPVNTPTASVPAAAPAEPEKEPIKPKEPAKPKEPSKSVEKDVEHGETRQAGTPDVLH